MGWFGSSSSSSSDSASDKGLRQNRKQCWESRDAYFACLDAQGIVKPGDEGNACAAVKRPYEKNCAKSWVCATPLAVFGTLNEALPAQIDYFNKRRVLAEQQRDVLAQVNTQAADAKRR